MKLNLGAGRSRKKGYINLDKTPYEGIQVVHNLDVFPWPFEDQSFDTIVALDVFEHLIYFTEAMDECWRLLLPEGVLVIQGPLAGSWSHFHDPTHRRGFQADSFEMFDRSTYRGKKYQYGIGDWRTIQAEEITPGKTMMFSLVKTCPVQPSSL